MAKIGVYTTDAKDPILNQIRQRQSCQTLKNCDYDIVRLDLGRVFLVLQIELSCDFVVVVAAAAVVVATDGDGLLQPRLKIDSDMALVFDVVVGVGVESVDS